MKLNFEELTKSFLDAGFNDLTGAPDEKKMLYSYAFYHYQNGIEDNILETSQGCDYKKSNNNKAQAFFETNESGENELHILSTLYYGDDAYFSVKEVAYNISEIEQMLMQIKYGGYFNENVNDSHLRDYFDKETTTPIKIVVLTNAKLEEQDARKAKDDIQNMNSRIEGVSFDVIFGDEIEQEKEDCVKPKGEVNESTIDVQPDNFLVFGEEKSLISNVLASSIKTNYQKYGKSGLFAQNLRFYVKNAKVDTGITESIQNKGGKFWYLNNGIIIMCDDYQIEDNGKIRLKKFSIVNGGQTTRMIGETTFTNDFYIMCKIIKNKYSTDREKIEFISEIAEASNTQKPIKAVDLVANKVEQRILKKELEDEHIYCQIKRGDTPSNPKVNYPEPWQKTKNDEVAQLLYASVYQKPGSARNNKGDLCVKESIYKQIFGTSYSSKLIKDLLIIQAVYKKWLKKVSDDDSATPVKKGLVKNGSIYVNAIIGLMAKFVYSQDYVELFQTAVGDDEKKRFILSQRTFDHQIFKLPFSELKTKLFELFELVYDRYYSKVFMTLREFSPELAYSNFTKVDSHYLKHVLDRVLDDFRGGINPLVASLVGRLFYVETKEDEAITKSFVENIESNFLSKKDIPTSEIDPLEEELSNRLKQFREEKYKEDKCKKTAIFTNAELDTLIKVKPSTIEELSKYGIFKTYPKTKIAKYGEQIIKIINTVYNKG